jgi:hypothetical protein
VKLELVLIGLRDARAFVAAHHRHNEPPRGHQFSIGLEVDGQLVGVVIAGRPIARQADDGRTVELYTLEEESGTSLRAAGFVALGLTRDEQWGRETRIRALDLPRLFDAPRMPEGPKARWSRSLA